MYASILISLLLVDSTWADFENDCLALNVGSVKSFYEFGSCFVVDTSTTGTPDEASAKCSHMSDGHLALAHVKTLTDLLSDFLAGISINDAWTALRQYDILDEPAGCWEWRLTSGSHRSDLVNWYRGSWIEPNDGGGTIECGMLRATTRAMHDVPCTSYKAIICQYANPIRHRCFNQYQNHRFDNSTQISDEGLLGIGMAARDVCAKKCGRHPLCFGFTLKRSDGHCLLHQDDGLWQGIEPIEDEDYDLYVMK